MRKDAATIQSMFGAIAPRYDLLNHLLSFNVDRRWRRRTVALAKPRGPVLDVCTGTGDLASAFRADAGTGGHPVMGLDFCGPMLVHGKDKKSNRGIRFMQGDALHLPFEDNRFDVVSVGFGIRNVADLDSGLKELVRVASPGGRIAVLEFTSPKNRVFRGFYSLYFGKVLPFIGNLVSRSRAYSYLNKSVLEWTGASELAERMKNAGCSSVEVHRLSFGIAAVHLGVKAGG